MAASATTVTVRKSWDDGKQIHVIGTVAIAAGYYVENGLSVDFSNLCPGHEGVLEIVNIRGISGYHYEFSRASEKLIIRQDGDPGTDAPFPQLSAAATPAAVVADTIDFYGIGAKFAHGGGGFSVFVSY